MKQSTERAIEMIKQIPPGKVMTYGQIAALAGSPRGARQVVRILHAMSRKHRLPWHRVINAKGEIGLKDDELYTMQLLYLQGEGVVFTDDHRVNLAVCQHHPSGRDLPFDPDMDV
ncbi:MGMT family protein [Brevibacillus massiliensis]|uniref:MGMT family protein n=1 Tax=Brevibacillus massiliensis TaxID=1118054 RepID=UPI0006866E32|nr:MGMT family protein [Brevibacillus massiliensis]